MMIMDIITVIIIFYALMLVVMTIFIGSSMSIELITHNKSIKEIYHMLMKYDANKYTIFGQFMIGIIWRVFFILVPFCIAVCIIIIVNFVSKLIYKNGGNK